MTILTCGLHDPNEGLKWISDTHIPKLLKMFDRVVVSASPLTNQAYLKVLASQGCIIHRRKQNNPTGNYLEAIKEGYKTGADRILYCDFDRAMHWVRTEAKELSCVAKHIDKTGYFVGMRGPKQYQTHHDALLQTEQLPNAIISIYMGEEKQRDYLSGCYGFSREAAKFVIDTISFKDFSVFGEWPLRMKQGGFLPTYAVCKGLAWETPDQHQSEVIATGGLSAYREQLSSPTEWKRRALMAQEFVKTLVPKA